MPKRYLAIRDSPEFKRKYRTLALRKKHAAMVESSLRKREGKPQVKWSKES